METISAIEQNYQQIGYENVYIHDQAMGLSEYNKCECCNHEMRYIGLQKTATIISIAHCDNCGFEYEF